MFSISSILQWMTSNNDFLFLTKNSIYSFSYIYTFIPTSSSFSCNNLNISDSTTPIYCKRINLFCASSVLNSKEKITKCCWLYYHYLYSFSNVSKNFHPLKHIRSNDSTSSCRNNKVKILSLTKKITNNAAYQCIIHEVLVLKLHKALLPEYYFIGTRLNLSEGLSFYY